MESEFETKLQAAEFLLRSQNPLFAGETAEADVSVRRTWPSSLNDPVRRAFLLFSELYLEATSNQRQILRDKVRGLNLGPFISEVSRLVRGKKDIVWIRIGLAAAGLGYADREVIAGLSDLVVAAERARFDMEPLLTEARQMSPNIIRILKRDYLVHVIER